MGKKPFTFRARWIEKMILRFLEMKNGFVYASTGLGAFNFVRRARNVNHFVATRFITYPNCINTSNVNDRVNWQPISQVVSLMRTLLT